MKTKIEEIHLDLDGLFAGFDQRVKHLCGKLPRELPKNRMWSIVHSDKEFFLNLEVINGSMDLWAAIKEIFEDRQIKFLTGAPSSKSFREQKKEWVLKTFGPQYEVNVVPRRDKQLWSRPLRVLIDDTDGNIHDWVVKGGHGIHHDGDFTRTITALREYHEALNL